MSSLSTYVETFVQFGGKQMVGNGLKSSDSNESIQVQNAGNGSNESNESNESNRFNSESFGTILMKGGNPEQSNLGVPLGLHRDTNQAYSSIGGDPQMEINAVTTFLPDDVFDHFIDKMN